jgi:hypothetical protein
MKHCCERRIVVLIHCYMRNRMHSPIIKIFNANLAYWINQYMITPDDGLDLSRNVLWYTCLIKHAEHCCERRIVVLNHLWICLLKINKLKSMYKNMGITLILKYHVWKISRSNLSLKAGYSDRILHQKISVLVCWYLKMQLNLSRSTFKITNHQDGIRNYKSAKISETVRL